MANSDRSCVLLFGRFLSISEIERFVEMRLGSLDMIPGAIAGASLRAVSPLIVNEVTLCKIGKLRAEVLGDMSLGSGARIDHVFFPRIWPFRVPSVSRYLDG